jgi:hypothetical protein
MLVLTSEAWDQFLISLCRIYVEKMALMQASLGRFQFFTENHHSTSTTTTE